ncbi:MAG: ABC transporter permease [Spirochaetaceae bacterium]|nr:ABC transporter permease [Spirochaetaceae bacterium]
MVSVSTVFACLMGLPLGVLLYNSAPHGVNPRTLLYNVLSHLVNIFRSLPFIILMILVMPFSRFVIGTSIGPTAVIIPLSIAAAPYVARIVESAIAEIDYGVVVAARAMGSTNAQIVWKVLIPEALPSLVSGLALTIINLIGYSAMAGVIGGEGLGNMAVSYGYYHFRWDIAISAVIAILLLVELVQAAGTVLSRKLLARR